MEEVKKEGAEQDIKVPDTAAIVIEIDYKHGRRLGKVLIPPGLSNMELAGIFHSLEGEALRRIEPVKEEKSNIIIPKLHIR